MTPTADEGLDAGGMKLAIVVSRFNDFVTRELLRGAEACLDHHGGASGDRELFHVPGAWEVSLASNRLAATGRYDAIIALGALIRGETPHFDFLAAETARGLGQAGIDAAIPVIFGVLTTDNVEQARARSGSKSGNKGWEAALAAIEMVVLYRRIGKPVGT